METKLRELQEKLALEEADKLQLQTQLHQCLESEVNFFLNISHFFKNPNATYFINSIYCSKMRSCYLLIRKMLIPVRFFLHNVEEIRLNLLLSHTSL